jgi:hypothetical protein
LGKCEHVNELLTILGVAAEYGKNGIIVERHLGVLRVYWASGCFVYITDLGYRSESFQESCDLGNQRDVMSHLHETCSLLGCR